MGGLRDLAVRADANVPPMRRRKAKSPSELVVMHKELQSLRREVQIAESHARTTPPDLMYSDDSGKRESDSRNISGD
jgi:hypothetical protein